MAHQDVITYLNIKLLKTTNRVVLKKTETSRKVHCNVCSKIALCFKLHTYKQALISLSSLKYCASSEDTSFKCKMLSLLLIFATAHAKNVCYPPYGCFTSDAPYDHALAQLPQSPWHVATEFNYHTRRKRYGFLDPIVEDSPRKANFNPNATTVFLVHGYIESKYQWYVKPCIDALLLHEDMNVVFVDWSGGSGFPYHQAYGNVRLVGRQLARMIEVIRNDTGINWSKLRLVGFSIGAHIVGFAGKHLKDKGMILPRITVLDAAAPLYEYQHPETRIDESDAQFVDAVHTDSNTLVVLGFGTVQRIGHIDFYPNGGYYQLGCEKLDVGVVQYFACSHYRSMRYFIESINSPKCQYEAYPCKSFKEFEENKCSCPKEGCPVMGYHTKPTYKYHATKYYMKTRTEYPYCGVHYKFTFETGTKIFASFSGTVTVVVTGEHGKDTFTIKDFNFKSGSSQDVMLLGKEELGTLKSVKVSHDAYIDIWYLVSVSVTHMPTNTRYSACFLTWLNTAQNTRPLQASPTPSCTSTVVA